MYWNLKISEFSAQLIIEFVGVNQINQKVSSTKRRESSVNECMTLMRTLYINSFKLSRVHQISEKDTRKETSKATKKPK